MLQARFTWLICLCMLIYCASVGLARAGALSINDLRFSQSKDKTRVVLDLNKGMSDDSHHVMVLKSPDRVVLDIYNAIQPKDVPSAIIKSLKFIKNVRMARDKNNRVRIVFDMHMPVKVQSFVLKPSSSTTTNRLVLDLSPKNQTPENKEPASSQAKSVQPPVKQVIKPAKPLRDVLIAIDAGHGGIDPGAVANGLREKDITLKVSRLLAKAVNEQEGMKALLIRDSDVKIHLRKRMELARKAKADLFISIHADAFKRQRARGTSIFALSLNGATSEAARRLADRENQADSIGGVDLSNKDTVLASVLMDLTQTATIRSSLQVGQDVLSNVRGVSDLHYERVQQAGFAVLKSPDIPSILIETGFITNPAEAKKLNDDNHQKKLVDSIVKGLKKYFAAQAPSGTHLYQIHNR